MKKRRLLAMLLCVVLVLGVLPISSIDVQAASEINTYLLCGTWEGTYSGFSGSTIIERKIRLDIDSCDADGSVEGFATIDNGKNGKYYFEGLVDFGNATIKFEGTEWLNNPQNFGFAAFSGQIDPEKKEISGIVDGESEKTFALTKISDEYQSNRISSGFPKDFLGEYDGSDSSLVVRRNIEIHIKEFQDDGKITGTAIISPSTKADATYGANGSYYFSGNADMRTGKISLQGYQWIDYPVQYDNFTFVKLTGYYDVKSAAIIGTSENGIWSMETMDYSSVKNDTGFQLGKDSNGFVHTNSSSWKGAGFVGMTDYSIDEEYFQKLTKNSDKAEKNRIKKSMHDNWGGSCYGIAMSMGLLYEKYISLTDLSNSNSATDYYSLGKPCDDSKFRNMINYYQLSQNLKNGGKTSAIVSAAYNNDLFSRLKHWACGDDSLSVFLKYLVNYASQDHVELLGFSTSEGGHAVLVTGCDYNKDEEQYLVKIFDENSVNGEGDNGNFSYMKIKKDFSSFEYIDSNGDKIDNKSYRSIYFLDWNSLGNVVPKASKSSSEYTKLSFLLGDDFKVVNDQGEYLEYDGTDFSGDMSIYNINTVESDEGTRIIIETDTLKSVNISDIENHIDMEVYDDNDYLSLSGTKIENAEMVLDKGIQLNGTDYTFDAYVGTDEVAQNENGLVRVTAKSGSDVTITKNENNVNVTTDEKLSDITTAKYIGSSVEQDSLQDSKNISITAETKSKNNNSSNSTNTDTNAPKDNSTVQVPSKKVVSRGDKIKVGKNTYKILNTRTKSVQFVKTTNNKKTITIPATVKIHGVSYTVNSIASNAFNKSRNVQKIVIGSKVKIISQNSFKGAKRLRTLVIKSTKLTKKGVRNSLKGSKIVSIKFCGGARKKMKLYKKIFAKKNSGKKVKIK